MDFTPLVSLFLLMVASAQVRNVASKKYTVLFHEIYAIHNNLNDYNKFRLKK